VNIHFDWLAPFYDKFIGAHNIEYLKESLEMPGEGVLLDAGGGTGRVSARLRPFTEKVVVCDWSKPMLKEAQAKGGLLLLNGRVERLPFPADRFDRILVVDALHHFPDQQGAIRDLTRVLKPGGRLVIEEPDINLFATKMIAWLEKITLMGSHFHSPTQISAMLTEHGLHTRISHDDRISALVVGVKPMRYSP